MAKPSPDTYFTYFKRYIDLVPEEDLMTGFYNQTASIEPFLNNITEDQSNYAYAEDKWTIKELLQHVIDTERIFNYRALCFARGEQQNLPGFEENDYAANAHTDQRKWDSLVEEFIALRKATIMMYESFDAAALEKSGRANNHPATALSIGFTTIGHYYHHKKILEERYLHPQQ